MGCADEGHQSLGARADPGRRSPAVCELPVMGTKQPGARAHAACMRTSPRACCVHGGPLRLASAPKRTQIQPPVAPAMRRTMARPGGASTPVHAGSSPEMSSKRPTKGSHIPAQSQVLNARTTHAAHGPNMPWHEISASLVGRDADRFLGFYARSRKSAGQRLMNSHEVPGAGFITLSPIVCRPWPADEF